MFEKQREIAKAVFGVVHTLGVSAIVGGIAAIATRNVCAFNTTLNAIAQISGAVSSLAISDKITNDTANNMDRVVDGVFDIFDPSKHESEQPKFTVIG